MAQEPTTAAEVVEVLGGTKQVADLLGVSQQAICNMRTRGSFPPKHWPALIRTAEAKNLPGVTLEFFESLCAEAAA